MPQSRTAEKLHQVTLSLLILLTAIVIFSLWRIYTVLQEMPAPPRSVAAPSLIEPNANSIAEQIKTQDGRITAAIDALKERAGAQQTLIATLTTLTGLYVVILSFAAYSRLQQTRDETEKNFRDTKDYYEDRFSEVKDRVSELSRNAQGQITDLRTESRAKISDLISEVRKDIPALHGVGERLEKLLAELDSRLPVDGDWTNATTYDQLNREDKEQAFVDEMVINSLDIFNLSQDVGSRRTISRLYVRLGQFYFGRANSLKRKALRQNTNKERETVDPDEPWNSLCRGGLYLEKAVHIDRKDPVALRARGVILMHNAMWKQAKPTDPYDAELLAEARRYIDHSLENDPAEPGALFARAWLLNRENPPDLQAAIKDLSGIIQNRHKLNFVLRRKFIDISYLNRANYTAKILPAIASTPEQRTARLASIESDLKEGMVYAKAARKDVSYREDLIREISPGGDLSLVYNEIKSTVDDLLAT